MWSVLVYYRCFIYQAAAGVFLEVHYEEFISDFSVALFYRCFENADAVILLFVLEVGPLANVAHGVPPVPVFNCELLDGPGPLGKESCPLRGPPSSLEKRPFRGRTLSSLALGWGWGCGGEISQHLTQGQFLQLFLRFQMLQKLAGTCLFLY